MITLIPPTRTKQWATRLLAGLSAITLATTSARAATGANINESNVTTTLYASPTGNDNNAGTTEGSPKSLQGAINAALAQNTKIILLDGDYRQYVSIPDGSTILILQAKNSQQARITGSDIFTSWTSEANGTFSTTWTRNWGFGNETAGAVPQPTTAVVRWSSSTESACCSGSRTMETPSLSRR
jgi:hypothetical protein